jgi:hypothetical protein
MAKILRKLCIEEISLVSRPANKHARVVIMKSAGANMNNNISKCEALQFNMDARAELYATEKSVSFEKAFDHLSQTDPEFREELREFNLHKNSGIEIAKRRRDVIGQVFAKAAPAQSDAERQLDELAASMGAANPKLTPAEAWDAACQTPKGRKLYSAFRSSRRNSDAQTAPM